MGTSSRKEIFQKTKASQNMACRKKATFLGESPPEALAAARGKRFDNTFIVQLFQ